MIKLLRKKRCFNILLAKDSAKTLQLLIKTILLKNLNRYSISATQNKNLRLIQFKFELM